MVKTFQQVWVTEEKTETLWRRQEAGLEVAEMQNVDVLFGRIVG